MSRLILIFGLFLMNFNLNYVKVESIEYLQEDSLIKEVKFSFESDSLNFHDILVNIKLYNQAKELLNEYQSSLKIIGRCEKTANIKFEYEEDFYAIIEVKYQDKIIVDGAKIKFYHQEDCLITDQDNYCNAIYKSEYRLGQSKDLRMEFNINKELLNVFLATNKLDVTNYRFYSNYDLDHKNAYLVIENSVNEYDLPYYKGYWFLLEIKKINNRYYFELVDNYYVDLFDFAFKENYFDNSLLTKNIYLPYEDSYKEYSGYILIEDYITIRINLSFFTRGVLFGECSISKYCLGSDNV